MDDGACYFAYLPDIAILPRWFIDFSVRNKTSKLLVCSTGPQCNPRLFLCIFVKFCFSSETIQRNVLFFIVEPRHSVGALPQCTIPWWQQAGSDHA